MFTELENGLGLDIVLAVQASRSDLLDALAILLSAMGGDLFFLIVLTFVYWSLNRKLGIRLLFALAVAGIVNTLLKALFQRPRPYQVSDAVVPLFETLGYGIPSGHVMVALVVWGYAAIYLKRRMVSLTVGVFVLLMMWARMYAGVHYPQDVIAGVLFGLPTIALYVGIADRIPGYWSQIIRTGRVVSVLVIAGAAALMFWTNADGLAVIGILVGTAIGLELESIAAQFDSGGQWGQRMLRYVVGLLLVAVLFFGLRALFGAIAIEGSTIFPVLRILRYGLIAVVALYLYPLIALRVGLASKSS